jgi:hypothetical protein
MAEKITKISEENKKPIKKANKNKCKNKCVIDSVFNVL